MDKEDTKLVLGLALGSSYTRAATAVCGKGEGGQEGMGEGMGGRPETVVNADGDRGIATLVALRKEEGEEGEKDLKEGEWLVGVSGCGVWVGWGVGGVEECVVRTHSSG